MGVVASYYTNVHHTREMLIDQVCDRFDALEPYQMSKSQEVQCDDSASPQKVARLLIATLDSNVTMGLASAKRFVTSPNH